MLPVLTAVHQGVGVWLFECPAHEQPQRAQAISSFKNAPEILKGHVDESHPGDKVRIAVSSGYSGRKSIRYTGKEAA